MIKFNAEINDTVNSILSDIVTDINDELSEDRQITFDKDAVIWGQEGVLDSIGLVTILVKIETALTSHYGTPIHLIDSRAMSQASSPFRTLGTLADYIQTTLKTSGIEK
jgi:acyl carrier protein